MAKIFCIESYYNHLKTIRLGRPCIYLDKVGSTIDEALNQPPDTIVLAKEQSNGRGQRSNVWFSPAGCAMGSIRIVCQKISPLASKLCFVQHIMILAMAKTLEQIDNIKLGRNHIKLKWPNDILYHANDSYLKIGGVLVHTTDLNDDYDIILSFGLNVTNSEPTTCIKDIIGSTREISIDELVAQMLNNLEQYTHYFDEEMFQDLKMEYTQRCMQMNKIIEDELNGRVKVKEVSEDGYLIGERCVDQKLCTVTRLKKT